MNVNELKTKHQKTYKAVFELGVASAQAKIEQLTADIERNQKDLKSLDSKGTQFVINERERAKSIICCEEAKGRESLAQYIAFDTEMTVEDAKQMLLSSPRFDPKAGKSEFEIAMEAQRNFNHMQEDFDDDPANAIINAGKKAGILF